MRDQHTHTRKVLVAKLSPQTLIKATNPIIRICSALTVRDAVEEVPVVGALLPHSLHFCRTWLEVAKVLLSQPRLLKDSDLVAWERGRGRVVRSQGAQDTFSSLACATVGGRVELQGVVWFEERAQLASCFFGLYNISASER